MVLLGIARPTSPTARPVLVVSMVARPPWVRLTKEQLSQVDRGFVWGVIDGGNGCALSLHRSKRAAAKEATWYNKTDRTISAQLSSH